MITGQRKSDLGYFRLGTLTCKGISTRIECINIMKYVKFRTIPENVGYTYSWILGSLGLLCIPIYTTQSCLIIATLVMPVLKH